MVTLIVGSYSLRTLPAQLKKLGISRVIHWDGLKARHLTAPIPREVEAVILLTDAVAHDVVRAVRRRAQRRGLKLIYARRSRASIEQSLKMLLGEPSPEHCNGGAGLHLCPFIQLFRRVYESMPFLHAISLRGLLHVWQLLDVRSDVIPSIWRNSTYLAARTSC